jgi:hypothetical protein
VNFSLSGICHGHALTIRINGLRRAHWHMVEHEAIGFSARRRGNSADFGELGCAICGWRGTKCSPEILERYEEFCPHYRTLTRIHEGAAPDVKNKSFRITANSVLSKGANKASC